MSRDPLAEALFFSRYTAAARPEMLEYLAGTVDLGLLVLASNAPTDRVDIDGAMASPAPPRPGAKPKIKKIVLKVGRCQILFLTGHHWQNPTHPRHGTGFETIQDIVLADPADKGCAYAGVVTCWANTIPNSIPIPGYTPVSGFLDVDDVLEPTDMVREMMKMRTAANAAADAMCKTCCCKEVKVKSRTYGLTWGEWMTFPWYSSWARKCP